MKELEQSDLYDKVDDQGITSWKVKHMALAVYLMASKINEIVRYINTHEKKTPTKHTSKT